MKNKYAFFTIDVERFVDTECVLNSGYKTKKNMLDGLDVYMKILDKHNIKATMFVLSDVAKEYKEHIEKHLENGHRLALHGYTHSQPYRLSDERFRYELRCAKDSIKENFGVDVTGYRAPCFGIDKPKLKILKEMGFEYDASRINFSPARHTTYLDMKGYSNPQGEIYRKDGFYEFGLSVGKFFGKRFPVSGGGYVRLLFWPFVYSMIEKYIKKNDYYTFYLHPFELSKERRPFIQNLRFYDKIYTNWGFWSYPYKLEAIIRLLKKEGYTFLTYEDWIENGNKKRTLV